MQIVISPVTPIRTRFSVGTGCKIPMQVVEWQTIMDEASDFREGRANRFAKGDSRGCLPYDAESFRQMRVLEAWDK